MLGGVSGAVAACSAQQEGEENMGAAETPERGMHSMTAIAPYDSHHCKSLSGYRHRYRYASHVYKLNALHKDRGAKRRHHGQPRQGQLGAQGFQSFLNGFCLNARV